MAAENKNIDIHFFQLVSSLQMACMQNLGKIPSPVTNKEERNLEQAQNGIEILAMLAEKTDGNLLDEEKKLMDRVLFELRMFFVEESKRGDSPAGATDAPQSGTASKENRKDNDQSGQ
jgi:hypothetical protein